MFTLKLNGFQILRVAAVSIQYQEDLLLWAGFDSPNEMSHPLTECFRVHPSLVLTAEDGVRRCLKSQKFIHYLPGINTQKKLLTLMG